jgi:hypothetical protein
VEISSLPSIPLPSFGALMITQPYVTNPYCTPCTRLIYKNRRSVYFFHLLVLAIHGWVYCLEENYTVRAHVHMQGTRSCTLPQLPLHFTADKHPQELEPVWTSRSSEGADFSQSSPATHINHCTITYMFSDRVTSSMLNNIRI